MLKILSRFMKAYKTLDFIKTLLIKSGSSRGIIESFHKIFYYSPEAKDVKFMGVSLQKNPLDLWVYQEIIYRTKPEVIVESGTGYGGSALFLASMCDILKGGEVITIDVNKRKCPKHPRIIYLDGSCFDKKIIKSISGIVKGKRCMVILDSHHTKNHVLKELEIYNKFVSKSCYLIVEDTNIHGHPIMPEHEEGPYEAVLEFLSKNKNFKIDKSKEKFLLTFNPNGFLLRIK